MHTKDVKTALWCTYAVENSVFSICHVIRAGRLNDSDAGFSRSGPQERMSLSRTFSE